MNDRFRSILWVLLLLTGTSILFGFLLAADSTALSAVVCFLGCLAVTSAFVLCVGLVARKRLRHRPWDVVGIAVLLVLPPLMAWGLYYLVCEWAGIATFILLTKAIGCFFTLAMTIALCKLLWRQPQKVEIVPMSVDFQKASIVADNGGVTAFFEGKPRSRIFWTDVRKILLLKDQSFPKQEPVLKLVGKRTEFGIPLSYRSELEEMSNALSRFDNFDPQAFQEKLSVGLSKGETEVLCWEGRLEQKSGKRTGSAELATALITTRIENANIANTQFQFEIHRAHELISTDPDMSMAKCRVILESLLIHLHKHTAGNPGTKRLEQLIRDLSSREVLPRKINSLCDVVRELGNVGSHPVLDDEKTSHREAQLALLGLIIIVEWYSRYSRRWS